MSNNKLSKRERAILQILNIVNDEGLHYGLVNYGIDEQLKVLKDEKLTQLVTDFKKITSDLEKCLSSLQQEVSHIELE